MIKEGSGPAEVKSVDDSGGTGVGSGGSGGELGRSFVELVKTMIEAKAEVLMTFGGGDSARGSENVGDLGSALGDERNVVRSGSKADCDVRKGEGENGNLVDERKTDSGSGVNKESGKSLDDKSKAGSGVNQGVEESGRKSLGDNGGEMNGKFGLVDVPIAYTSENGEEGVGDELADDGGYELSVGDFVWGKIKSHPWWPGQICDPSDASDYAAKLKPKGKLLVAYFGDDTFAWCYPSQLKPFGENFLEISKLSSSRAFVNAVQQALDEIGRLVQLKMSCGCMQEEFLNGLHQPLTVNACIKEGVPVPEGRVGKFLGHLCESANLLAELKHIAQVASFSNLLELNVLKSLLAAFYCSKGGYQLPTYLESQSVPGLEDDRKVVEVPVQGTFQGSLSHTGTETGKADQSLLQSSPPSIESRQPHKRKQKSIADLLKESNPVEAEPMDEVKEGAITEKPGVSSRRKQQKGSDNHSEGNLISESGKGGARLSKSPVSTDITEVLNVESSGGKDETKTLVMVSRRRKKEEGIGIDIAATVAKVNASGNEETKKTPLSRRRKRVECIGIDSNDGDAKEQIREKEETKKALLSRGRKKDEGNNSSIIGELADDGIQTDLIDQDDMLPLSRQRKRSKYLSAPFVRNDSRKRKCDVEIECPNSVKSHDIGKEEKEPGMEVAAVEVSNEAHDMGKEGKVGGMEMVAMEVSSGAQVGNRMTRAATNLLGSPQSPTEGANSSIHHKIPGSKAPAEVGKKPIDPVKANAATNELLFGVRSAAVDILYTVEKHSFFEIVVDFISIFRDSVYRNGSRYKLRKNYKPHGKRKKSKSEPGSLGEDNHTAANFRESESGKRNSKKNQEMDSDKPTKKQAAETPSSKRKKSDSVSKSSRKDSKKQDKPTDKQAAETPSSKKKKLDSVIKSSRKDSKDQDNPTDKQSVVTPSSKRKKSDAVSKSSRKDSKNKDNHTDKQTAETPIAQLVRRRSKHAEDQDSEIKETNEKASPPASLFVTFGPGSSLPSKDDLLRIYSKYGELDERGTEMFYTNFCARISFVRSCEAEDAFNQSLLDSPFGASNVNFRLQIPSGTTKTRELSAIIESPPSKKSKGKGTIIESPSMKSKGKGKGKTASEALVASNPPVGESSQLDFIKNKLEMMVSILGNSDRQVSSVSKSKLENEMKDLLQTVSTMAGSST